MRRPTIRSYLLYEASVLKRAWSETWNFTLRTGLVSGAVAALFGAGATAIKDSGVDLGLTVFGILAGVGTLAALWFVMQLVLAPWRLHRDIQGQLGEKDAFYQGQIAAFLAATKNLSGQYAGNIHPLPRAPHPNAVRRSEANRLTTELENNEIILRGALETGAYWNAAARPLQASQFNDLMELNQDAAFVPIRQRLSRLYNDLNALNHDVRSKFVRNVNLDPKEHFRVEDEAERFETLLGRVREAHADVTEYIVQIDDAP